MVNKIKIELEFWSLTKYISINEKKILKKSFFYSRYCCSLASYLYVYLFILLSIYLIIYPPLICLSIDLLVRWEQRGIWLNHVITFYCVQCLIMTIIFTPFSSILQVGFITLVPFFFFKKKGYFILEKQIVRLFFAIQWISFKPHFPFLIKFKEHAIFLIQGPHPIMINRRGFCQSWNPYTPYFCMEYMF